MGEEKTETTETSETQTKTDVFGSPVTDAAGETVKETETTSTSTTTSDDDDD
ncbi:MAG TPA: hypothetical protein VF508_13960 [Pyrinomonadaceae bacterium]|jgi:hypothetical protein